PQRRHAALADQLSDQARYAHQHTIVLVLPGKGDYMLPRRSFRNHGEILSVRKQAWMLAAKAQGPPHKIELDAAVFFLFHQLPGGLSQVPSFAIQRTKAIEQPAAHLVIDRPSIVGINQAEVPE